MAYFNTTNQTGASLREAINNCNNQEEKVTVIFRRHRRLSASQVLGYYPDDVPLTSIRRAMTGLIGLRILAKTNHKRTGIYGKPESIYELIG